MSRPACFAAGVSSRPRLSEFDGRPGPVRDRIAEIMKEWLSTLRDAIVEAQKAGQLKKDLDPIQLAFEFNSLELGANWAFQLYGDKSAFARAREAIHERLARHSTKTGAALLSNELTQSARV